MEGNEHFLNTSPEKIGEEQEERIEVLSLHESVKNDFREYFREHDYIEVDPLPLIAPKDDPTVVFVGSSIDQFKSRLEVETNMPDTLFVVQPCIRTQDFDNAYNTESIPFGQPYFHILGTFSGPNSYQKTCIDAVNYFLEKNKIPFEQLLVKPTIPELSEELLAPFNLHTQTEVDPTKHYKWKYGIPDIHGVGVTFYLFNKGTGSWWDVGNAISIRNKQGQEIASEFGIGLEFFITAKEGLTDPFLSTVMSQVEKPETPLHKKMLVYLETTLEMFSATPLIGKQRASKTLRKYLNNIHFLLNVCNVDFGELQTIVSSYYTLKHKDQSNTSELFAYLQKRDEVIKGLHSIVANNYYNKLYPIERYKENIRTYCVTHGIHREEVVLFMQYFYPSDSTLLDV